MTSETPDLSILGQLGKIADGLQDSLTFERALPWFPIPIVVRCGLPNMQKVADGAERESRAKRGDLARVSFEVNADVVIEACRAVVALKDGQELSLRRDDPFGAPTTFDADLADALGHPGAPGRDLVRLLFVSDAALGRYVADLIAWSATGQAATGEALQGE